jgi:hypothetical protein
MIRRLVLEGAAGVLVGYPLRSAGAAFFAG